MRYLVSVIIPTYNCANYIEDAIVSVLNQTYNDVEVIVIDDCSTDNTEEIIRKFKNRILNIKNEGNKGAAATRNVGIKAAKGEFIATLDADDLWLPKRLEVMMKYFDDKITDFVTSNAYIRVGDKITNEKVYQNNDEQLHYFHSDAEQQYLKALEQNFIFTMCIVKKEILFDIGLFDEKLRYHEDWDLWLRLLRKGHKVRLIDEPLAIYTRREGSKSRKSNLKRAEDHKSILEKHLDIVSRKKYKIACGSLDYHRFKDLKRNNKVSSIYYLFKALENFTYLKHILKAKLRLI